MGYSIGLLTANLATIIFVLTQCHLIFLTSNWLLCQEDNGKDKLKRAVRNTFPASFWSMLTTLLGFGSLLFVEAKPLNELGVGGSIGTLSALICAYCIFPAYLSIFRIKPNRFFVNISNKVPVNKRVAKITTIAIVILSLLAGTVGISRLNTDPSLLSYFDDESEVYEGIYDVDQNGGSNPLLLVISRIDSETLDESESYDMMWALQNQLSEHQSVGSVISLPVLLAEGDEHWLGQLLPWDMLIDILSGDEMNNIGRSFVTEDNKQALFFLRMKEGELKENRIEIIEEIKQIPSSHGFSLDNIGGTYYLQGELAESVEQSMISGIFVLFVLFGVIIFLLSLSLKITFSVTLAMAGITFLVLGTLGLINVPVDIISSPSINICLGIAVDGMIHLIMSVRRKAKALNASMKSWKVWESGLKDQAWPTLLSGITLIIGFCVFAFSDFPPSQRFGLEIVYGAFLAILMTLIVVPYLASRKMSFK